MKLGGRKKGFTILELLIVVAIIGILTAATLVLLSDTRARGRDAKRLSDMREIEKALNLYYSSNQNFPTSVSTTTLSGEDAVSTTLENAGHISHLPPDPHHPILSYQYVTDASGTEFTLTFCLETDTIQTFNQGCDNTITP
jgi:prepilin-type N-terminal cleavage/methylation domain-containing protein